jgi:hypothetical protein
VDLSNVKVTCTLSVDVLFFFDPVELIRPAFCRVLCR